MQLDEDRALQILEEECEKAQDKSQPVRWEGDIRKLCSMADETSQTYIAAFGTQALAKATDLHAYTLSKNVGDKEGGYSARGFCKRVLAAEAPRLGIDLGVTGREPLNNQPFFYVTYMDEARDRVKGPARDAYDLLIKLLRELDDIQQEKKARQILRAFLRLRIQDDRRVPEVSAEGITDRKLSTMVDSFVSEDSEGGRRAQAATAAMFDAAYNTREIATERINDPDRHLVGDVGVYEKQADEMPLLVAEVRDKPIEGSDLFHFVRKVGEDGVHRACVIAVAAGQDKSLGNELGESSEIRKFSASHNVRLRVYFDWEDLIGDLIYWSGVEPNKFASDAYQAVLYRSNQLEISDRGLELWAEYGELLEAEESTSTPKTGDHGQIGIWEDEHSDHNGQD